MGGVEAVRPSTLKSRNAIDEEKPSSGMKKRSRGKISSSGETVVDVVGVGKKKKSKKTGGGGGGVVKQQHDGTVGSGRRAAQVR